MTTWAALLASLRKDLQDDGVSPRWADATLFLYACDAIRDYSGYFPKRVDRYALEEGDTDEVYSLPSNFVEAIYLECPEDTFLEERGERPGRKYYDQDSSPHYYYLSGGSLYLNGSPSDGDSVLLTYFATHPIPASETDNTFELSVPDRDLELIRLYVKASVHAQMRDKTARLDRFDPGSGRRDDNPLLPAVKSVIDEYYRKIAERVPGGAIRLYRTGRVR